MPAPSGVGRYLPLDEVAHRLGVSFRTALVLCRTGALRAVVSHGVGRWFVRSDDVKRYERERRRSLVV